MPLNYSLNLSEFSDRLRLTRLVYHCPVPLSTSRTAGGDILRARIGTSLWQGEATLTFARQVDTRGLRGLLDALLDPAASFFLSPHDYYGPAGDPGGAGLSGQTPALDHVFADGRVQFSGLPAGYALSPDDLVSWDYGQNPVRTAFHRVVGDAATAGGAGNAIVRLWPLVRPGWVQGAAAELVKPRLKAVLTERDPGESVRVFHSGMSFSFTQSLR